FSSRRRHTRFSRDWSSDVCSSDLGTCIIMENLIDSERRVNTFSLMMSLNMLVDYGDAFDFTPEELKAWLEAVGFKSIAFQKFCRSEERRVGKECRSRWRRDREEKR